MSNHLIRGAIAGAAGTVALNVTTYLDMTIRARPGSSVPATTASRLAGLVGVDLAAEGADQSTVQNRQSGLGALMGFGTGLGIGIIYGLFRSQVRSVPKPAAGVGLGLLATAGSDAPATALGVVNPKSWGANSWLSDLIPHMAYGFVTAIVFDKISGR